MKLNLVGSDFNRGKNGAISGQVTLIDETQAPPHDQLFQDRVTLTSAKGRAVFAREIITRFRAYLNGHQAADIETRLMAIKAQGEGVIAAEATRRQPWNGGRIDQETGEPYHLTELGNAKRFVAQHHNDVRHCEAWGWMVWDGQRWMRDAPAAKRLAKATVQAIYIEAGQAPDRAQREALATHALRSESHRQLTAMLALAESEPEVAVKAEQFDRDPWLLNCLNGTINLRTGELHPHRREDFMSRCLPITYDPKANCPLWMQFLHEIMAKNTALIEYLQRAVGYSLTGSVQEQCFFFCYGTGQNGKSTFLLILLALLGEYAMQAMPELLMVRRHEVHPTERADLYQKRLVTAVEIGEGERLTEALVKLLTGGERIRARRMREDFWEFEPTHKFWLAANHKPVIRGTDDAIWRRPRLIPFTVRIPDDKKDPRLLDKLKTELPGILRWAVDGCLDWHEKDLQDPPEVMEAGQAYRAEMDTIGQFLAECCTFVKVARTQSAVLYNAYCAYAGDGMTQTMFSRRVKERGFKATTIHGRAYWQGIQLIMTTEEHGRG